MYECLYERRLDRFATFSPPARSTRRGARRRRRPPLLTDSQHSFFFFFVSLEVRFSTRDQYPASSPLARFAYATQFPKNVEKSPFTNQSL
jgi:hypothetical protein